MTTDGSPPRLETRALGKRFGAVDAVRDVTLHVHEGSIYGLLGPNGAGKTTILRMALGLLKPTSGSVLIDGRDIATEGPEARRHVGAFVEGPSFYGRFDAISTLRLLGGLTAPVSEALARETLELVGLPDVGRRAVRTFSLGMRQRLGLALALLPNPRLLILDEPSNGLDPQGIKDLRALILRLRDELGMTFIVSSHLLHEIEQVCDRVAILVDGRLVRESDLATLREDRAARLRISVDRIDAAEALLAEHPETAAVHRLGDGLLVEAKSSALDAAGLNALLVARGHRVSALVPEVADLEELFFAETRASR